MNSTSNLKTNENINLPKKKLIVFDLDGTILPDFTNIDKEIREVVEKLKHRKDIIMCIATGRNYLSSIPIYKELGMNSYLITYNGAYINNPSKNEDNYMSLLPISNKVVREILEEEIIKKNILNILIDNANKLETISSSDDIYYREVFFNKNPHTKVENVESMMNRLKERQEDCLQLVLEFNSSEENEIIRILRNKYKNSVSFYFGSKLKKDDKADNNILIPDETKIVFKLRNKSASKSEAIKVISSYYNLSMKENIIAFGNDINDIEMLSDVWLGVAMLDSAGDLKLHASDITREKSKNSAVAKYLKKMLNL